jgi:hypothetical protein
LTEGCKFVARNALVLLRSSLYNLNVANERTKSRRRVEPIGSDYRALTARGTQPAFDGTIASAGESVGISLEQMIEMMRWAKESDPRVAQFLEAWDALDPSERHASGTADAVRQQVGLKIVELLRIVAEMTYRIAMYKSQISAAMSHPEVVAKTVERALTDDGIADRMMLHKATGFLPMPRGAQTTVTVMQNAQANATSQPIVEAPSPEQTIRQLADAFNQSRESRHALAAKNSELVPIELPKTEDDDGA